MHAISPFSPSCQPRFASKSSFTRDRFCLRRKRISHHSFFSPTHDPIRHGMFSLGYCIHDASSESPSSPSVAEDTEQAPLKWFERPCKVWHLYIAILTPCTVRIPYCNILQRFLSYSMLESLIKQWLCEYVCDITFLYFSGKQSDLWGNSRQPWAILVDDT